jgi:hypothetical protein
MMTSCFFFVFSLLIIFDTTTLADSYSSKSKTSSKSKSKKGKAQSDLVQDLLSQIAELELQLSNSISIEESDELIKQTLINEYGLSDWAAASLPVDQSLSSLSNAGRANIYEAAGWPIYYEYSPEPSFYLQYAASDTVVRDMQGDVFKFPETGNKPEDIAFTLPPPPAYEDPSDLIFMPILQIASLLRSGAVDCVTVVQTFINRLDEFDPYLAIVSLPLYDRALEMAAAHDELLAQGTDLGPLMCIPYGVKDHHQIFDDDITTYGNILYANNIQKTKSSVMAQLMKYGAIPIAKTNLGTFASGSVHGHGECMSPYLTGGGGGSSCGSGSGAALGALVRIYSSDLIVLQYSSFVLKKMITYNLLYYACTILAICCIRRDFRINRKSVICQSRFWSYWIVWKFLSCRSCIAGCRIGSPWISFTLCVRLWCNL